MTFQEQMTFLGMKFFQVLLAIMGLITGLGELFVMMFVLFIFSWIYFIVCNVRTQND